MRSVESRRYRNSIGVAMYCKRCQTDKQSVFNGEVAIHFSGHEGLDKSLVFVFPKLAVCFHCGFTEFTIPARELRVLDRGSPVDGAAVLPRGYPNRRKPKNGHLHRE